MTSAAGIQNDGADTDIIFILERPSALGNNNNPQKPCSAPFSTNSK